PVIVVLTRPAHRRNVEIQADYSGEKTRHNLYHAHPACCRMTASARDFPRNRTGPLADGWCRDYISNMGSTCCGLLRQHVPKIRHAKRSVSWSFRTSNMVKPPWQVTSLCQIV
ncbi:unnamed protein product, partial [Ectocarpus sp. 13 AM-2016]